MKRIMDLLGTATGFQSLSAGMPGHPEPAGDRPRTEPGVDA